LLGFKDAVEARRKAEAIARQLATGDVTAATRWNAEAANFGPAIERWQPTGVSLELAAATFAEAFQILNGNAMLEAAKSYVARHTPIQPKSVAEVIAELIAVKESRNSSLPYLQDLRTRLGRFAAAFKMEAGNVTTPEVQAWLDGLKRSGQRAGLRHRLPAQWGRGRRSLRSEIQNHPAGHHCGEQQRQNILCAFKPDIAVHRTRFVVQLACGRTGSNARKYRATDKNQKGNYDQKSSLAIPLPGGFQLPPQLALAVNPACRGPDDTDLDWFGQQ